VAGKRFRWLNGYHVLVAGGLAFLTIPRMAQPGMFLDGVTYAAVARNLAMGQGSFWRPWYSETLYPEFFEQPALGLGLQALVFVIVGDSLVVERLYSFIVAGLIAFAIAALWRETGGATGCEWLPLLFWLVPSAVTWSVVNNMLETTQALLVLVSIYAFLRSTRTVRDVTWGLVAGTLVVAAVLTKGPVGAFPLVAPFALALVTPDRRREAMRSGVIMWGTAAGLAGAVLASPEARRSLSAYADQQLFPALVGNRQSGNRMAQIARHLGTGVILRMSVLLAVIATGPLLRGRGKLHVTRPTVFLFLLAACGSLPLVVSGRIAGHYLVPAIPLFALAFARVALPFVRKDGAPPDRVVPGSRWAGAVGVVLIAAAIAVPVLAGPIERRDEEWMKAFSRIGPDVPSGATLGTCIPPEANWGLYAYMQRFFRVSLDAAQPERHPYFWRLTDLPCGAPPSCETKRAAGPFALLECSAVTASRP
jgi:4-amino-4-deoxy-L-arabinose transferase-like glycosyltransferase